MAPPRDPPRTAGKAFGSPASSPPDAGSQTILVATVGCTVFMVLTALAMLGPLLVVMSADWHTTVPMVAQLVSATAAAWAAAALVAGPVSDAYGRRPIVLTGAGLVGLASIGTALAPDLSSAAVFRILAGVGGGMLLPTCIALIGDVVPAAKRATSVAAVTTQPGLSSLMGVPLMTLVAAAAGWRTAFWGVGGVLLACSAMVWLYVPASNRHTSRLVLGGLLTQAGRTSFTWMLACTNLAVRAAYGLITTFFPAFLQLSYGLSTAELALPVSIVAVGTTCGMFLGGRLGSGRRRRRRAAASILGASLPGVAVFMLDTHLWWTVGVTGVFMVLSMPVATLTFVIATEVGGPYRGTLTGMLSSSGYASYALGAALGGLAIAHFGYAAVSLGLLLATVGSGLLLTFLLSDRAVDRARLYYAQTE